ncbi:sugar phosphate isomerase/epimerase [Actinomadura alba]|uniref:Sugar phosphate isomerase/epimerase n=2 Tax=Actinomadura alba TaxID=406431 RepID=A0ABR7LUN4_9ACTN|nr:sugar phosphate isomerase/epimerase [Actinomadura alba]
MASLVAVSGIRTATADTVPAPVSAAKSETRYFEGDYKVSLNLYSFNVNLNAWLKGRKGAPPIDTLQAIRFAKEAGFDAVDVTAYYIPGYDNNTMPTKPRDEIMQYAREIKELCRELGLEISGTGAQNDFADPDDAVRALDVERLKFWIDVAAEMGAPVMRVFSGVVPNDIDQLGWETIARNRIVPPLRELADYGAARGVRIGLQNHGDMTATADQTIQILRWVDSPNIGIIDDTGYFRPFRSTTGLGYDWYRDIAKVLPYSNNFQVKKKPAGAENDVLMDLDRLFTDVRLSAYRGYIPLELLWTKDEPTNPKGLTEPPYDQISEFLGKARASLARTKTEPFEAIDQSMGRYAASGELRGPAYAQLRNASAQAQHHFEHGRVDESVRKLRIFVQRLDATNRPSEISDNAQQTLSQQANALIRSLTDVFGPQGSAAG